MVSKARKQPTPKSAKIRTVTLNSGCRKTPKKPPSPSSILLISSLRKSLGSCKRCVLKLLSGVLRPSDFNHRGRGFHPHKIHFDPEPIKEIPVSSQNALLPPPNFPFKATIFLDLDETLVHSSLSPPPDIYDFVVNPSIDGHISTFYVKKRPGIDEFFEFIEGKFEVVIFTAGLKVYAEMVIDKIDKRGVISHRLYRDSCKEVNGKFIKDLSKTGRDIGRMVIIDDNPDCFSLQKENAIQVRQFVNDLWDTELSKLVKFLEVALGFNDIRQAIARYHSQQGERLNL
ncbi:carboxy-terminal domain RNA polymerase II polypeptide A small phosphatase 1 [Amborella trichopoda]|uniref:FCP1 homology domain-containing protein n=1 Tax=Amborella trichopoda TaxID=13333 RepID=W1PH97_AMBTC|nr:carboxy-terminal domain RNA polymerase II polypeptide A small phosphatase 1 [Amborella trichopoda]ERN09367.1 hypothetical protein AMTR_s00162p00080780 [Amborella trichopoda]|eukprot:XP_006847786.1 carboxy-terminal domain RNA polymerase II polypeptide A small phosphatase 1 [Amborella trichopoda]